MNARPTSVTRASRHAKNTSATRAKTAVPPHAAVAQRFRYFLDATSLSRQELVDAVGGAITARSLFSVLSGQRQPSRALARLIESAWGFRADYLLAGEGEPWATAPAAKRADLTPAERDVLAFMRSSAENARAVEHAVDMARLWSTLFARTSAMLRELDACARGDGGGGEDAAIYPLFAKLAYDDCLYSARKFAQLAELTHRRRVHKLSDRFVEHYVGERPRAMLAPRDADALVAMLAPVTARRRERLAALDAAIAALRATLETLARLGSPRAMLLERSSHGRIRQRKEATERLRKVARGERGKVAARLRAELDAILAGLGAAERAEPALLEQMKRLVRDLARELETEVPVVPRESAEELRALHQKVIEPLVV